MPQGDTKETRLKHAVESALSDRGASSAEGCGALANALIAAFVRLRRDPKVSGAVAIEMRRLAERITQLADAPADTVGDLAVGLSDDRLLQ